MPKKLDLLNRRFGQLVVLSEFKPGNNPRQWNCVCDRGKHTVVWQSGLMQGGSKTCGHGVKEAATKHGDTGTRLFGIWTGMKGRCYIPSSGSYKNYGGKGIKICDEWKEDYVVFKLWALANGYKEHLTIDRKNGDKDYTPDNCRWATMLQQAKNQKKISNTSSQYIGVSFQPSRNKWLAMICHNNKHKNVGRFNTELEAAKARDQYIIDNNLPDFTMNFD